MEIVRSKKEKTKYVELTRTENKKDCVKLTSLGVVPYATIIGVYIFDNKKI